VWSEQLGGVVTVGIYGGLWMRDQECGHYNRGVYQVCSQLWSFYTFSAAPRVKEEDVKQLSEMFPTLEKDVIHSVLEANNGQVNSAVTSLLQMTEAQ